MTRFARIAPVLLAAALSGVSTIAMADDTIGTLPSVTISQSASQLANDIDAQVPVSSPAPKHVRRIAMQTIDTSALSQSAPIAASLVIQARATTLRPAPLPDQDFDAPGPDSSTIAAQKQASVAPSFYSAAKQFSGDGYSAGSSLDTEKNNRRKPAGGMSLSIPMP